MNDEEALLRVMIATPEDNLPRLIYADWLDEHNDRRAELLRTNWNVPRLSFMDWIGESGGTEYYLKTSPEVQTHVSEHEVNRSWRNKLSVLATELSHEWVAVIDTIGRPFQPFYFWNNTGPRSYREGELPFHEQIGTRGTVVTFESAFRGEQVWQTGLMEDLGFLYSLSLENCSYGTASCPVHSFACEYDDNGPITGTKVLRALKGKDFRSQHIMTLDSTEIEDPGYQPYTDNDEIHNDPEAQRLFPHSADVTADEIGDDLQFSTRKKNEVHLALRNAVVDGQLCYVLLHSRNVPSGRSDNRGSWVVLFAVGLSLRGRRLIGVVSHQMCHNLCD